MDKLESALENLKIELDKSEIVQEYLRLKQIVENDENLKAMRSDIARLASEGKTAEHDALLEIYNSHPVVVNYQQTKEEITSLLREIKDILSE